MIKKLLVYILLYCVTLSIILSVFFLNPIGNSDFPLVRLIIVFFATVLLIKYFVYMFICPWHDVWEVFRRHKQEKSFNKSGYKPKVSVLVPAWNEENGIITTTKALLRNSYRNMEIIIIDNASTDNTKKNVKDLINKYKSSRLAFSNSPKDIVYLREERQGKSFALNKGIRVAKGDIIISIDADCYVPLNTIKNFVKHFQDPKVMAVVGNVKIGNTQTLLGVIQYLEFLFSFYFKKSDSMFGSIYIIGGAAGAFRKEVFKKLGDYNTSNITEDIDLSVRIQFSGMKIAYAEDAIVYTEGATDLAGLIKQRLRWKRGRFETFMQYRSMFFSSDRRHNKFLSWVILPLAVFGDIQLVFELLFILFVCVYSYLTNDYSSFISGIVVVSAMFGVQLAFDPQKNTWKGLLFLAPIGWLLLYVSTFVEFNALIKAIFGYVRGEKVLWQKWQRNGVFVKE